MERITFMKRIAALQQRLKESSLDCAVIVQNQDLYYYTGTSQNAHLIVPVQGEPLLLVKKDFERARRESPVKLLEEMGSLKQLPETAAKHLGGMPEKIAMELDVLPARNYLYYQKLFPAAQLADVSSIIREQRMVKDAVEMEILRNAGKRQVALFKEVPTFLRAGMTELEVSAEIESRARKNGHQGRIPVRAFNFYSYFGHLLSGESGGVPSGFDSPTGGEGVGPMLPQGAGWKKVQPNEPVYIDYCGGYAGYIVDMTRIFCVGRLPQHLSRAYQVSVDIQNKIVEQARPGVSCEQLYMIGLEYAEQQGLAQYYLGYDYTLPFVGHGVGLELDELPVLAKGYRAPLLEGMVLAIEPKFIFPGEGAVGIENTYYLSASGMEKLTDMEDNIIEI